MKHEITYDTLLERIPNKYILTIAAGKRVREIVSGAPLLAVSYTHLTLPTTSRV